MKEYYLNIEGAIKATKNSETKPVEDQLITINGSKYIIVEATYEGNDEYHVIVENTYQ